MSWRSIDVKEFNELTKVVIDVRSPCEHIIENIPGSVNVPLLSDEERAIVGTTYKEQGELTARRQALSIVSPKMPELVDQIISLKRPGHALIIHCWRGGLRSEAVASFLSVVGVDSFRLSGGYKAWRRQVVDDFAEDRYQFQTIVLDGLTGSGKTDVLSALTRCGEGVIDLEHLANHRGSVFGGIGLGQQPTQKNFEAALWSTLRKVNNASNVFVEAEGRKIGRLAVPTFLLSRIKESRRVLIEGTLEARCKRIVRDYAGKLETNQAEADKFLTALRSLQPLKERVGNRRAEELSDIFACQDYNRFVELILTEYYDPLYARHIEERKPYDLVVCADDPEEAAEQIVKWSKSVPVAGHNHD
jgi:tRNA 2-selenouridine synthase